MPAAHGERLARRAAGDEVDLALQGCVVELSHIAFFPPVKGPVCVFGQRVAGPTIYLDDSCVLETRHTNPEPEASRPGEQLD